MFTNYVSNPVPVFIPPLSLTTRHDFVQKLYDSASNRTVCFWEGFRALQPVDPLSHALIHRHRFFNLHRAQAIQAITLGLIYHLDVANGISRVSVDELAHQCGLSTESGAISRASRAIITLEQFGILKCEKERGRAGARAQKRIEITPLFIDMCGINSDELAQVQLAIQKAGRI